ncbi:Ldh family oxidoreductase, partial [Priestia megaterium]|uniref:Ldh family oxidoreductase n=1 Tax=Priestia megaterium TaxID=1404 RepID=UPI00362AB11A
IAQLGFDRAFEELRIRASTYGVTVFSLQNSYTTGELGYYVRRLARKGLVALAATNGPALMAAGESSAAVYGTNPLAFAAPVDNRAPLVIDQASSATAFVHIREAAKRGEMIPEGWAIDADGQHTIDSREAIKGALLAFGGARGANIALMVEILAAGATGANWSLDAPSFEEGSQSPGAGLFIVALNPELLAPDFSARMAAQIDRLSSKGIHIPGGSCTEDGIEIDLPSSLVATLEGYGLH